MSKRKLLLADDSVTIQKVVNLTFADEGIEVITVGDGDAAMKKFIEAAPDLVMVDVNMPGLDGYRICEMIKQDAETAHIPVILLVGSFEPFDETEARRVGADDFLTKPFQSIRQLVNKVSELLSEKDIAKENFMPVENISAAESDFDETNETNEIYEPEVVAELVSESNSGQSESNSEQNKPDDFEQVEQVASENYGEAEIDDEMIQTSQFAESADAAPIDETFTEYESEPVSETESFYDSFNDDSEPIKRESFDDSAAVLSNESEVDHDLVETQSFSKSEFAEVMQPEVFEDDAPLPENKKNAPAFNFDDFDLLEFPQLSEKAVADQIVLQNGSELSHQKSIDDELKNAEISLPKGTEISEDSRQTGSVSPELIEAIANKVVEKISSKFIEKVVREVLSQMEKNS